MKQDELIPIKDFCTWHNIEFSFIDSLENSGLISITSVQQATYVHADDLIKLEKFVRLYYDLDINMEGIETINHLLDKIEDMQQQIVHLKNRIGNQQPESF